VTSVTCSASDIPVSEAHAVLAAAGVSFAPPHRLVRTRFDTADGRLHAAGLRLELRSTGPAEGATTELVLTDTTGAAAHLALPARAHAPVGLERAVAPPTAPPLDPASLPRGPFRSRLLERSGTRPVLPQVTVTSQRASGVVATEAGAPRAVVHLDRALVVAGVHAPLAWAAELTPVVGHDAATAELRTALGTLPARWTDGDVLELALTLAGVDPLGSRRTSPPELTRRMPALHGFRAVLRLHAATLDAAWDGIVSGTDPAALHDLCDAVEQTRVLLVEGRRVLPPGIRSTATDRLRWLDTALREARDLERCLAAWPTLTGGYAAADRAALEPLHETVLQRRSGALEHLAGELRSARATMIRRSWLDWLAEPDDEVPGGARAARPLGTVAATRIEDAHAQIATLARAGTATSAPGDHDGLAPHAARLACLLAAFGPLAGRRRDTALQDAVDPLTDQVRAEQHLRSHAEVVRAAADDLARADTEVADDTATAIDQLTAHLDGLIADARTATGARLAEQDRTRTRRAVDDALERMRR
jgi:hypothetical protein